MSTQNITTPLALSRTRSATITLPWFVQGTEYNPAQATFGPLVNGEEAFGAVHDAIAAAKHTVDIICWGFQPSMYFKRGSDARGALPIGELLEAKGRQGVKVRLLVWSDSLNIAQFSENMTPGNNIASYRSDTRNSAQRALDLLWYWRANLNNATKGAAAKWFVPGGATANIAKAIHNHVLRDKALTNVEFATRDFGLGQRAEIAWRTWWHGKDAGRSKGTKSANSAAMAGEPSHHQKMVLVDYETPEQAIGFVMGHNTLDEYWDRDDHGCTQMPAQMGRSGAHPRQDISSRVTGAILKDLTATVCQAWDDATGHKLEAERKGIEARYTQPCAPLRRDFDTPVMAQVLRTQSQHGKQDIEKMYLQAANNTTKFIYIENQYFRFAPLADQIKKTVKAQFGGGRDQGKHGPLYLFVVTNSNDDGIGLGTVNTYRMLDSLGRADTIPGVARAERAAPLEQQRQKLNGQLTQEFAQMPHPVGLAVEPSSAYAQQQMQARAASVARQQALKQQIAEIDQRIKDNGDENKPIKSVDIDGLKVHICTLMAPDWPAGKHWKDGYVYVHAKLMIVDDVFMTLGSANVNTRSMEVDSELNICHEHSGVTAPLRKRLWGIHTKGMGAQEDVAEAFDQWDQIIDENKKNMNAKLAPISSLAGFMRTSAKRSYLD